MSAKAIDPAENNGRVANGNVKVLYIASSSRSGSTLLGNLLGQLPGVFNAGEVRMIWHRSFQENRACGCGRPFNECDVWHRIVTEAFGDIGGDAVADYLRSTRRLVRMRYLVPMLIPFCREKTIGDLTEYLRALRRLYEAIATQTRSTLTVDTSKSPPYGFALGQIDGVDVYTLHLLRDPRAVAYSELRTKIHPDTGQTMGGKSLLGAALGWNLSNMATDMLLRAPGRYLRLGYETLVDDPRDAIEQIGKFTGEPSLDPAHLNLSGNEVVMSPTHTVFDNPDRFKTGTITLRVDDVCRTKLPQGARSIVNLLTWPARWHYREYLPSS